MEWTEYQTMYHITAHKASKADYVAIIEQFCSISNYVEICKRENGKLKTIEWRVVSNKTLAYAKELANEVINGLLENKESSLYDESIGQKVLEKFLNFEVA